MTINQLFKKIPPKEILITLLNLYGIDNFEDSKFFTKKNLCKYDLINNLNNISTNFEEYYLPCKFKIYFKNLTLKKSITILRQLLKLYDYYIKSHEKYIKGEKIIMYQILPKKHTKKYISKTDICVISFD